MVIHWLDILKDNWYFLLFFFGSAIIFFILLGIIFGNTLILRVLMGMGLPVLSGKILRDYRATKRLNGETLGWISIPNVCYAPIMQGKDGFYKNHDFRRKESTYGELVLSYDKSHTALRSIANPNIEGNCLPDLTVVVGSTIVKSRNLRTVQFTLLRRLINTHLRNKESSVTVIDKEKSRKFSLLFAVEMGIEQKRNIKYSDRKGFIESMRSFAIIDSKKPPEGNILILSGVTEIDNLLLFLIESKEG